MAAKREPKDTAEGPEAAQRFEGAVNRLLRVTKEELSRREAEYQNARKTRVRPGPKPKK